jgi:hypothetical protein
MERRMRNLLFPWRGKAASADPHAPWQPADELSPIGRQLVILRAKAPFLQWCQRCDPELSLSLAELRADAIAYLVPCSVEEEAKDFIDAHYGRFFAQELSTWSQDPKRWPKDRSLELFRNWFDVEAIDMVLDVGDRN